MLKKLVDVCSVQYGYAFDSDKFTDDNSYLPIVRIRDVKRGYSRTYYSGEYSKEYVIHDGDILIGMDGEFNIAFWKGGDALLNQRVCKIIPNSEVNKEYLRYFLSTELKKIEEATPFATVKHLSSKTINKITIDLPDRQMQNQYSDILCVLEDIEKNKQKQIDQLDALIKSRFVEMFGDHNYFETNISSVADVQVGIVVKPAQYYTDSESGIKTFRSLNVGEMTVKNNDWIYITPEGNQKNSKSILKENDLVIVRSGAPGTACVVNGQYAGCNAIDVIIAHPDLSKVNPYYLCAYTNSSFGKQQIEAGTGGAAQQHFNVGKYKKMNLILPPMSV